MNTRAAVVFDPLAKAGRAAVDLVEYYSEAGPDYGAWSHGFNMHFGFYRWGTNPLDREAMLEQMNVRSRSSSGLTPETPAAFWIWAAGWARRCAAWQRGCRELH